jgi:hypothetical protein
LRILVNYLQKKYPNVFEMIQNKHTEGLDAYARVIDIKLF